MYPFLCSLEYDSKRIKRTDWLFLLASKKYIPIFVSLQYSEQIYAYPQLQAKIEQVK